MESVGGMHYFLLLVDDCIRFNWIYMHKKKSELAFIFLHFEAFIKRQFCSSIKMLQSDGGTELKSLEIIYFLVASLDVSLVPIDHLRMVL